ncbi:MAG: hypothetical protein ACJ72N_14605 [Labedaea sp.]
MKSERRYLKDFGGGLIAVLTWLVLTVGGELLGNQANDTAFGRVVGHYVLLAVAILAPVALIILLVLYLRDHREEPAESEVDDEAETRPPVLAPPPWHQPEPLQGRESELDHAIKSLLENGIVALVGPRDVGTSAVAETVVQRLVDSHEADPAKVTRFDLRSQSSARPDDARAAAGRILSAFGLDEPADDSPAVLAGAGHRLVAALRGRYDVLMLDNASAPEEIEWLVRRWPAGGRPWLVIAGESATEPVVEHSAVFVGELDLPALRAMWEAELPSANPRLRQRIVDRLMGRRPSDVDALLRACFGRPRAVKAFAREILRPDSTVTIERLLTAVNSTGPVDGPLERVWTAILDHVRDGLPANAVWLLHALAELPVTGLTRGAVLAMLGDLGAPGDPLEELRIRNLVQEDGGRYRLPSEVRRALAGTTGEADRAAYARRAVPALLRHYAADAALWAGRLGSGADVLDWFHDAERTLRPLFNKDSYLDERLLALVIDDLALVADALEGWYVREQQSGGLLAVNDALHVLAERAHRPELAGIAAIRVATAHRMAGRPGRAVAMLDVAAGYATGLGHDLAAELAMREHVERALLGLAGAAGPVDLAGAEAELRGLLSGRPKGRGGVAVLINLGALCVAQGRPDEALRQLRAAERLAGELGDLGGQAHALELQGIALSAMAGRLPDAVRLWLRAREVFVRAGEEQGEARCLQHLGSAALHSGTAAGQIRDGRPDPLDERVAAGVALPLLERAKRLRAGQPGTQLVDGRLSVALRRLGRTAP